MSTEENKALVRKFFEEANVIMGNPSKIRDMGDKFFTPEFTVHQATGDLNLEQYRQYIIGMASAFPDAIFTIEDMVAEGDKVAIRLDWRGKHRGEFRGMSPTGKSINVSGAVIYRIANGKFTEAHSFTDALGMMQQLGAIPEQ